MADVVDLDARIVGGLRVSDLDEAARIVARETRNAVEDLGEDSELVFAAHALRKSGRMARSIAATGLTGDGNPSLVVTAEAKNPETGFDYVGVTRFGHRVSRIYPKQAKALRTPWGPRMSVRGFRPATDWRDDALPAVRELTRLAGARISRRLEARV